jgi:pimeloyl-ACP methyl ester carboxylesterase
MLAKNPLNELSVLWATVARVFGERSQLASEKLCNESAHAFKQMPETLMGSLFDPWKWGMQWWDYTNDFWQRSVLFLDALRQRGDNFVAHEKAGKPPLLHFEYEIVLDARKFERPVNYALVRIIPPLGVTVDPNRRPYVIIDPRAGHGPGIGGFKDDSQVGVALRDGHPVYFVIFFPEPEPGQTLLDVCDAEAAFVRRVREFHPRSAKPVIIGNCQGGWATMMLAASNPDQMGPIVIIGSPLSYWGGAWRHGEGDNPMRYAGGLLGGTWLASLASDLGNGQFDGANLVANMENLNPANTCWDKYYHLFDNIDTEAARFLEFERWWGGFYLQNREEMDWIIQNLFVGNRVWETSAEHKGFFDLRQIRVPIILFASLGDNITPPQQSFNWVADVYKSTDEIKARGQTIIGLLHEDVGHLGIFVSGKVARKETAQIVSVLKSVEALPPGLYGMEITERPGANGKPEYSVEFIEHSLEDVVARLNRFGRMDEKPFEAAAMVSEFNQRAYDLFISPAVQATSSPESATFQQQFHPLRMQRWSWSSLNPWLSWLKPTVETIRERRRAVPADHPLRTAERLGSEVISAQFDCYRDIRDALYEAMFFGMYGSLFAICQAETAKGKPMADRERQAAFGVNIGAAITEGGLLEAVARVDALLAQHGEPLQLSLIELKKEFAEDYKSLLPDFSWDDARRIRGVQDLIVTREPKAAIEALPELLVNREDRRRFLALLEQALTDPRVRAKLSQTQTATLQRIRTVVTKGGAPVKPLRPRTELSDELLASRDGEVSRP